MSPIDRITVLKPTQMGFVYVAKPLASSRLLQCDFRLLRHPLRGEQEHADYRQLLYFVGQRDFFVCQGNDHYHLAIDQ